jgi:hypothetical protein
MNRLLLMMNFCTFKNISVFRVFITGADPWFQVRGAYLKKLRRAEGGANIFGVFRVKNHDFTTKYYSNFMGGSAPHWQNGEFTMFYLRNKWWLRERATLHTQPSV